MGRKPKRALLPAIQETEKKAIPTLIHTHEKIGIAVSCLLEREICVNLTHWKVFLYHFLLCTLNAKPQCFWTEEQWLPVLQWIFLRCSYINCFCVSFTGDIIICIHCSKEARLAGSHSIIRMLISSASNNVGSKQHYTAN